jgi:hypothetical protein
MNRRRPGVAAPQRKFSGLKPITPIRTESTPPRNKPCPCLSKKKYKYCCKDIETLVNTINRKIEEAIP